MIEAFLAELEQEAATTRLFLEAVPGDKLAWRPHDKSMSLGQLALHVAGLPGRICDMASAPGVDTALVDFTPATPASVDELLPTHDAAIEQALEYLQELDEDMAMETWTLDKAGETILAVPRIAVLRSLLFNHWYHHRGQLSVYLRLLDVPVPVAYGRTADVDPFA